MLKHAFKCAFKTKYIKNLSEIDSLKEVCPKYIDLARRNGPRMNLKELYSARIAYQKNSFASNKKPKILLGGILTFLGLQKPEQQEPELILTIKKGILLIKVSVFTYA